MSTIYSAGQFDDAFSPKRLRNWEVGAKDTSYHSKQFYPGTKTEVIADSDGHLLPWIPRDKSRTWGLLNYHMQRNYKSNYHRQNIVRSATVEGLQQPTLSNKPKKYKLPKYTPKRQDDPGPEQDPLLEYLQDLTLPIIWIIGPSTKHTFQTRKQFSKRLASSLGFSYIHLDEKIHEWKERQTACTCHNHNTTPCSAVSSSCMAGGVHASNKVAHSLASTSIAPSKLPTNVPPLITVNLPSPHSTRPNSSSSSLCELYALLESQRIAFDTALPMDRNKILELYKFAMAEGLPCGGFVMDSVPYDLVEGIAFEKIFYPATLAIYFTEGVPPKRQLKAKDRRVTASTATSEKKILSPMEYLEKGRKLGNGYMRTKHHKRLGNFTLTEGEKICKQFGSKTIRIINAEDVENDTMEFLNELVKKNLNRHHQRLEGASVNMRILDIGEADGTEFFPSLTHPFVPSVEVEEADIEVVEETMNPHTSFHGEDGQDDHRTLSMPPALVTARGSDTSVFTIPNIFASDTDLSISSLPTSRASWQNSDEIIAHITHSEENEISRAEERGGGDNKTRQGTAQLWEKIMRLESKVADLNPAENELVESDHNPDNLPPPTAYSEETFKSKYEPIERKCERSEEETLTAAIRNMVSGYGQEYMPSQHPPPQEYDYGAAGDCPGPSVAPAPPVNDFKVEYCPFQESPSNPNIPNILLRKKRSALQRPRNSHEGNKDEEQDSFFNS